MGIMYLLVNKRNSFKIFASNSSFLSSLKYSHTIPRTVLLLLCPYACWKTYHNGHTSYKREHTRIR